MDLVAADIGNGKADENKLAQKWHRNADNTQLVLCYTDIVQNHIIDSEQVD